MTAETRTFVTSSNGGFVTPPTPERLSTLVVATPIGEIRITGDGHLLSGVDLPGKADSGASQATTRGSGRLAAATQLEEYFAGERRSFDLDLAPSGTPFQLSVWSALLTIEYGATASYGDIARMIRNDRASRAVGSANNRNPIALVIPCHRVIGSNGSLVGYGGGLPLKEYLLGLESAVVSADTSKGVRSARRQANSG